MTDIVLTCQRCSKEFASHEGRGMRCLECAVKLACEQYRSEYRRLSLKLERLRKITMPVGYRGTQAQFDTCIRRIAIAVRNVVLDPHHQQEQQFFEAVLADFNKPVGGIVVGGGLVHPAAGVLDQVSK